VFYVDFSLVGRFGVFSVVALVISVVCVGCVVNFWSCVCVCVNLLFDFRQTHDICWRIFCSPYLLLSPD
jgi:hypothetical protein